MMLMTNVADDDRENGDDDITGQCDFVQRNHVHPVHYAFSSMGNWH